MIRAAATWRGARPNRSDGISRARPPFHPARFRHQQLFVERAHIVVFVRAGLAERVESAEDRLIGRRTQNQAQVTPGGSGGKYPLDGRSGVAEGTGRIALAVSGEVLTAELFVAALGASSYTFAEATWTQTLPDWIGSHTRAYAFLGGVPAMTVSDNLRSGITKASFYEPAVNRSYAEMAAHYDTAIIPARPRKPRDKAKVEAAVLLTTRWIIAKLRNRKFFSLVELNEAIRTSLADLNNRVSRHLGASRRALFEEVERSALKPLPTEPYVFAAWKECGVGLDYHVEVEKHYYSVPHTLLREKVWARITARTVEVFHRGKRVAAHARSSSNRRHTTVREHMPSSHQRYADWTPESLKRRAGEIGRSTSALVEIIMRERTHPEQGFRACVGILRFGRTYGTERVEAACARALQIGARSYSSVKSILKNDLDRRRPEPATDGPAIVHANIRGPTYFH